MTGKALGIATIALAVWLAPPDTATAQTFPSPQLIGEWQGDGRIIVTWCKQKQLPIHIFIRADRKVSGTVGDASITAGRIRKNNWFLTWLGNSEYVIEAKLDGPIVAAENIRRESIQLLLDTDGHLLEGGFHTSGSEAGGKASMAMSGTAVMLSRVQRLDTDIGQIRLRQLIGKQRVGHRSARGVGLREEDSLAQGSEHHDKTKINRKIG